MATVVLPIPPAPTIDTKRCSLSRFARSRTASSRPTIRSGRLGKRGTDRDAARLSLVVGAAAVHITGATKQ